MDRVLAIVALLALLLAVMGFVGLIVLISHLLGVWGKTAWDRTWGRARS